jgi:hypothetical protein
MRVPPKSSTQIATEPRGSCSPAHPTRTQTQDILHGVHGRFSTLRFVALLSFGALVLHDLRYRIGYHEHAASTLRDHGHAYLSALGIFVGALVALTVALFAAGLLHARRRKDVSLAATPSFGRTWVYATLSLAAIYVGQEWLEGQLAQGHPQGLAGIVGHGGWAALPLAVAIAAMIALLLRGSDAVLSLVARHGRPAPPKRRSSKPRPRRFCPPLLDAVSRHLAGRGPPLLS